MRILLLLLTVFYFTTNVVGQAPIENNYEQLINDTTSIGPYETDEEEYIDENEADYSESNITLSPRDPNKNWAAATIPQEKWNQLTDDPAFNYEPNVKPPTNNAFTQAFMKLIEFLSNQGIWIIWLLIISIVTYILYLIIKKLHLYDFKRANKKGKVIEDDIIYSNIEYEQLINEHISKGDFPLAVRYIYQHIIYLMRGNEELKLKDDLTNYQILKLVRSKDYYSLLKQQFAQFEWVQFGAYPIAPNQFEQYHQRYQILKNKVVA